jgi:aspartyl aminopeptidase
MAVFDSEEIGSGGENGAASSYLSDTLLRISKSMDLSETEHLKALSNSFFASVDSTHALHPNHPELFDKTNTPIINSGIAIKYSAAKRYTTSAVSAGLFMKIASLAQVPCQSFSTRSDLQGGSTLGHISQEKVSVLSVDIGAPILSMHSSSETAGTLDTQHLARAIEMFYSVIVEHIGDTHIIR